MAKAKDELDYMKMAIKQARLSKAENDERKHPLVGAVIVTNGRCVETHRGGGGELGGHAEYVALDIIGKDDLFAGSTLFTTLEPCTTRKHPKVACVERIIDRQIKRVVIG